MTPKEKAEYLYSKMYGETPVRAIIAEIEEDKQCAKKCALIAVDEILNELSPLELHPLGTYTNPKIKYFEEVKQEIELL
jgi:hypothetical protein